MHNAYSMAVLEVKNLSKTYDGIRAVDDISFSVEKGEIVGLLGPNGAGKTTTISMILGVLEPSGGSILVGGVDVAAERSTAMGQTNFAAVYAQLPGNMTVRQNLHVFSLLYGVADIEGRIGACLREYDLERYADTKAGLLSSGEQTRVSLAKAMLNSPQLLLLDEPTASVDPATAHTLRARIREFAAKGESGVLWTSHNMHEVEAVCDRVLFLSRGKILLKGDPKTLPAEHRKKNLEELFIAVARESLSFGL